MATAPQHATSAGSEIKRLSLGKRLLVLPLALIARLWLKTLRMPCLEEEREDLSDLSEATAIILWHNRLSVSAEYARRYRKKRRIYALVSGSRDGAWLETFFRAVGVPVIRGSRKRRGSQAIRDMVRTMKEGYDLGITPDGSSGPCYEMKPGAATVVKMAKAPALLLSFEFRSAWRLKSWDGFYLPKPFSRVLVRGKRLSSDFLAGMETGEIVTYLERELKQLTLDTMEVPSRAREEKPD